MAIVEFYGRYHQHQREQIHEFGQALPVATVVAPATVDIMWVVNDQVVADDFTEA